MFDLGKSYPLKMLLVKGAVKHLVQRPHFEGTRAHSRGLFGRGCTSFVPAPLLDLALIGLRQALAVAGDVVHLATLTQTSRGIGFLSNSFVELLPACHASF